MTPKEFCYWLMGSLELTPTENGLDKKQTQILRNHLDMCFVHMVNDDGTLKPEKDADGYYPLRGKPIKPVEVKVNC